MQEDLKANIQELQAALDHEREARREAEVASSRKSDAIAIVSHELRTPLSAMISLADLLAASQLSATQIQHVSALKYSAKSLLTILNDILDHSKLDAGQFELDPAPFDLRKLMESVRDLAEIRAKQKGLQVHLDMEEVCQGHFSGDEARLRQILDNLTDNALKFTEKGSIDLSVRVTLCESDVAELHFEVRDTGIGIAADAKTHLFHAYRQADRTVSRTYGGTGLGLAIARQLVELMGGAIGCKSYPGKGSCFWFTVRLYPADAGGVRSESNVFAPSEGLSGHVLIVDDNEINQMLLKAYLTEFGLTYDIASSGEHALKAVSETGYGLVLMDVMMPGMSGLEAAQAIRKKGGACRTLPIIALTANAGVQASEDYLTAGMGGYLCKPIDIEALFHMLSRYLHPNHPIKDGTGSVAVR